MIKEQKAVKRVDGLTDMTTHLDPSLKLTGELIELVPMHIQHTDALIEAASQGELWNLPYTGVPTPSDMPLSVRSSLEKRDAGVEFPFVVTLKDSGKVVGSTRYYYISAENRNLSIGYTWYSKHVQRTGVNTESKYQLLKFAFETMHCISVQWHTDHRNKRSQAAIRRLGAQFEGILRNNRIMPDGVIRHTHCFSMLDSEWPNSKAFLESRMQHYADGAGA